MSEALEHQDTGGEVATVEDVQRTLAELKREKEDLSKELERERRQRVSLESNLDVERTGRATAEAERDTHAARVVSEAELRWNAEREAAQAAITAKQKDIEQAEEAYSRHADLGDWKEAAKAQRIMAEAAAEATAERQRLKWLESNKEKLVPKAPVVQPRERQEPGHRYQKYVGALVGGEEEWLDQRPKFQSDPTYREEVIAASNLAGKRYTRGSEKYLREIERLLDEDPQTDDRRNDRQSRNQRDHDNDEPAPRQRSQSADLPPSRRAGPGERPSGSDVVAKLTEDEMEMADGMYGNPNNSNWYEPDRGKRYKRYAENLKMMQQMRAR
jgi:hypothetical protein